MRFHQRAFFKTSVYLPGASGRMGQEIIEQLQLTAQFYFEACSSRNIENKQLKQLLAKESFNPNIHLTLQSAIESTLEQSKEQKSKVIIDFTSPETLCEHIKCAKEFSIPLLVGTTGLQKAHFDQLKELSLEVPVLYAANTSIGANILASLVQKVAQTIPQADAEVLEIHHNQKKDAPSGTALLIAQQIEDAHNMNNSGVTAFQQHTRSGNALRAQGEIGVQTLRGGNVPGEHHAYFFLNNERIELSHKIQDRRVFAEGALIAAQFLAKQKPGFYSMKEVLNLNE